MQFESCEKEGDRFYYMLGFEFQTQAKVQHSGVGCGGEGKITTTLFPKQLQLYPSNSEVQREEVIYIKVPLLCSVAYSKLNREYPKSFDIYFINCGSS
jgi:hypothetical protein